MKNQFLYLVLLIASVSCSDEVKFNTPAFEGQKDNVFWRAVDVKASIVADGSLLIEAYTRNEKLTLSTSSTSTQIYTLGIDNRNTVTYVLNDKDGLITFSTGVGIGEGRIEIEEYDAVKKTITGTFKFNAQNIYNNPLVGPILNFQYGNFYKVPVN